jgi:hypothetical protein
MINEDFDRTELYLVAGVHDTRALPVSILVVHLCELGIIVSSSKSSDNSKKPFSRLIHL